MKALVFPEEVLLHRATVVEEVVMVNDGRAG
jgi:hypothetical protein